MISLRVRHFLKFAKACYGCPQPHKCYRAMMLLTNIPVTKLVALLLWLSCFPLP